MQVRKERDWKGDGKPIVRCAFHMYTKEEEANYFSFSPPFISFYFHIRVLVLHVEVIAIQHEIHIFLTFSCFRISISLRLLLLFVYCRKFCIDFFFWQSHWKTRRTKSDSTREVKCMIKGGGWFSMGVYLFFSFHCSRRRKNYKNNLKTKKCRGNRNFAYPSEKASSCVICLEATRSTRWYVYLSIPIYYHYTPIYTVYSKVHFCMYLLVSMYTKRLFYFCISFGSLYAMRRSFFFLFYLFFSLAVW